jgi:hypothetical protein
MRTFRVSGRRLTTRISTANSSQLATIDWAPISGPEGIGAHGRYFHRSKCIVIDEKFKFSKDAIRSGDEAEGAKLSEAMRWLTS